MRSNLMTLDEQERVVLVDGDGSATGSAAKATVHTSTTPLHLGFSCYLMNDAGAVLLTRRALTKATWPGVWTNSFCGHPAPEEEVTDAVARRAAHELGAEITDIRVVSADFRYRAIDASGVVENEICPVFTARLANVVTPHPDEVAEYAWVAFDDLARAARLTPFAFSPWMLEQLPLVQAALGARA